MVLDEGGGGDRSGKEGALATETGDLGGGLEVAELLMCLQHGGHERGVGAGAVTVTGDPLYPVFAMGMELPASGRPVSPADDQRPCFNFPRPPTLKTSSSDLERKQAGSSAQALCHGRACITYSRETSSERNPRQRSAVLAVGSCCVSPAVCTSPLTNRDYFSPNIFFKMMKQFPNSILIKEKKKSRCTQW